MNSVISVSDFYFNYLRSDLVLKNVNIEIEKGSFTVIIGPSGAGKTTLCKAMTGIVPFYSGGDYAGEIKVLGESTKGKKVSDLAMKVGLMLEDYESQLVSLTAGEEVAFSLLNHGFPPEEAEERTRLALEDVGLPGRESYQLDERLRCWRYIRRLLCWTNRSAPWIRTGAKACINYWIKSTKSTAPHLSWWSTALNLCCPI